MAYCLVLIIFITQELISQVPYVSKVWVPDNDDATYKNPILNTDYSDADP